MSEYVIAYVLGAAVLQAGKDADGAAQFYWGDIARWILPRLPDAPDGWH